LFVVVATIASVVRADWNPGDPHKMHYPQLPDLGTTGLDVLAGPTMHAGAFRETFLADDFRCTSTGPVTDVHIWGSFNQDIVLGTQPPRVSLAIYADVPAGPGVPFSHPGQLLWDSYRTPQTRIYAAPVQEGFFDPALGSGQIIGSDTQVWQYNFNIPAANAFVQSAGTIYWLGVHYSLDLNQDGNSNGADFTILTNQAPGGFGWKTSLDHFNDDAVWTSVNTILGNPHVTPGVGTNWRELIYPAGHPLAGQSMDLAFVIGGIPEPSTTAVLLVGSAALMLRRRRR
jgi:hypothetical protein